MDKIFEKTIVYELTPILNFCDSLVIMRFIGCICDITMDDKENFEVSRKKLISEISDQNNIITKIRAMLLSDDLHR